MKSAMIAGMLAASLSGCVTAAPGPNFERFLGATEASQGGPEDDTLSYAGHGAAGSPILLIHGFGASRYAWRHLVSRLSEDHRLLTIDLKGFGSSPKPEDQSYSLYDQASFAHRFILRHALDGLTLVGHSSGGGVALLVALKLLHERRQNVAALILIDTIAYPQELPLFMKLLRAPVVGWLGVHVLPEEKQVRWILEQAYHDPSAITPEQIEAYAAPLREAGSKHALLATALQIIPSDADRVSTRFETITVPTLVIWGADDRIVPIDVGRRLHRAIAGSTFVVIDHSGHIPHEEMPDATLSAIKHFLRRIPRVAQRHRREGMKTIHRRAAGRASAAFLKGEDTDDHDR